MPYDLAPLILTLKLAVITTLILFVIGVPLGYWLAFTKNPMKLFVTTLVSMPLVLPPTVLGFYLLVAFGSASWFGAWMQQTFHISLVFSFTGLVIGSLIFSLPFMVNPIKSGFEHVPQHLIDAAKTLGKSPRQILQHVLLPLIAPSLWTGIVMSFAHTIGEFGVVLMIGGNIPGETRTASMSIFSEVEALNYHTANFYAVILLGMSFGIVFVLHWLNRNARIN